MKAKRIGRMGLATALALLALLAAVSLPAQAAGAVHYVAPGGVCGGATPCYGTLQAAVDAAAAGDEVRVAAGMYPIQAGSDQVVRIDKSLSIRGGFTTSDWNTPDPEANATILNPLTQGRAMALTGDINVTVEGLQLIYGSAEGLGGHDCGYADRDAGGGLFIDGASVTIRATKVLTSTAIGGHGGGIYAKDSPAILIEASLVQANDAGEGGGIFLNNSNATIFDSEIDNNTTSGSAGGCSMGGGGFYLKDSTVNISYSGITKNDAGGLHGGGLIVSGGEVAIRNATISENNSLSGGGLEVAYASAGQVTLLANTIISNTSTYGGGGIAASNYSGSLYIAGNVISANRSANYGAGGGLYISGKADILRNVIEGNYSCCNGSMGGGVYLNGTILFQDNTLRNNISNDGVAGGIGGGMYVGSEAVTVSGNLIQNNRAMGGFLQAGFGGGVYVTVDAVFMNNVITGNQAEGEGSQGDGVYIRGASPTFFHTTLASNLGVSGSGIYVGSGNTPAQPTLHNTILVSQTVGIAVSSYVPQNLATLYGVLWFANVADYSGTVFAFDEVSGDPIFADPAGRDYHLQPGSAAIDAGVSTSVTQDLDGEPRGSAPDLGADEYWEPGSFQRFYLAFVKKN